MLKDTIKTLAAEKGLTMRELSDRSGVPYSAMAEWNASVPNAVALAKVCKALGTSVEAVLEGVDA